MTDILTAGESDSMRISEELNNYDHDSNTKPIDTFRLLMLIPVNKMPCYYQNAEGVLSCKDLQGLVKPNNYQHNIRSTGGREKVLFVSEKMAALQVVYKRLANVGLVDFCFTIHSHRANKRNIA